MADYRLYLLDQHGHISSAIELDCANDIDATATAQRLLSDTPAELWQRERRVEVFQAERKEG